MANKDCLKEVDGKNHQEIQEEYRERMRKYYHENKHRWKESRKEYYQKVGKQSSRKHRLHTNKGLISGLNKRDWTGYCELCGKTNIHLSYHHWDDKNPSKGLWVCNKSCHDICEAIDTDQLYLIAERYLDFKKILDKEDKENAAINEIRMAT